MLLPPTLPVLILAAVAYLANASPNYRPEDKVCSNLKRCDRDATPYCSSVLRLPVKTTTTTICKTKTIVKTSTASQNPKPATTVTVTETPTVSTCRQPLIPTIPVEKHKRYAASPYKPHCLKPYTGNPLSSACKCLSLKPSTTTSRTTKIVKTITQTTTTTKTAAEQITVTTTSTAATPVFAVPTGPLHLFALGTGNDLDTGLPAINSPNQYLAARASGSVSTRQAVSFNVPRTDSPRIRFNGTALTGVDEPLTNLVAGISDIDLPGTVAVVFDVEDSSLDNVLVACRVTSAVDGTCPVVCGTEFRPLDANLELWSLASAEEFVGEPIDTFAVSPVD